MVGCVSASRASATGATQSSFHLCGGAYEAAPPGRRRGRRDLRLVLRTGLASTLLRRELGLEPRHLGRRWLVEHAQHAPGARLPLGGGRIHRRVVRGLRRPATREQGVCRAQRGLVAVFRRSLRPSLGAHLCGTRLGAVGLDFREITLLPRRTLTAGATTILGHERLYRTSHSALTTRRGSARAKARLESPDWNHQNCQRPEYVGSNGMQSFIFAMDCKHVVFAVSSHIGANLSWQLLLQDTSCARRSIRR